MTFSKNSTITCFSEFFVLTCGVRFPQPSGESFESTCMQGLAEGCKLTLYMEKAETFTLLIFGCSINLITCALHEFEIDLLEKNLVLKSSQASMSRLIWFALG